MTAFRYSGLAVALFLMVTPAEGQVTTTPPVSELVEAGRLIFAGPGLCFACHGPAGSGIERVGPDLTDTQWLHGDGGLESIARTVRDGVLQGSKTGGLMPPRGGAGLSDEQVRAVAAYVWSLSRRAEAGDGEHPF